MTKKSLSLILALMIILSAFAASPLTAFAEDTAAETDTRDDIIDMKTGDLSPDSDIAAVGSDMVDPDYPGYEYVLLDDGTAKITSFQLLFMPEEIRVPETLGGHQVTETGTLIFRFYKEIKKIILPNGLKTIGSYTSSGCTNLSEVVIPNTVTKIDEGAFYGCTKLTAVNIPASVTEIGPLAFGYYWDTAAQTDAKIIKLTIRGKKGSAAEKYAKDNGFTFEDYDIPETTTSGKTGSCKWELSSDNKLTIYGSGAMADYSANGSNTPWAAHKNKIIEVIIEKGVINAGSGAFAGMTALKNVAVKGAVDYIGEYAFKGCTALTSVEKLYTDEIRAHAFDGCTSLSDISITHTDYIRADAFRGCSSLSSVDLGSEVKYIETGAFEGCSLMDKTSGSVRIGKCFLYADPSGSGKISLSKKTVTIAEEAFFGCKNITELNLPNSVKYINGRAFFDCTGVKSVIIPDPVVEIGEKAFGYYSGGKVSGFTVYASEGSAGHKYAIANGFKYVKYTPDDTLYRGITGECDWTLNYKGVLTISPINESGYMGDYHFQGLANPHPWSNIMDDPYHENDLALSITEIVIEDGVKGIGTLAFPDFYNLKKVTIPSSVEFIQDNAFSDCRSLSSVDIPDSVTYIGSSAFAECYSLSDIKIGNNLDYIPNAVFYKTAYYNDEKNWKNNGLYLNNYLLRVKNDAAGTFTVKDGTTLIAEWAFDGCDKITEVKLPQSIKYINSCAFHDCISLKKINLSSSKISSITPSMFYNCGFSEIELPNKINSIGAGAFASCKNLTEITVPDSVSSIYYSAFSNCEKLSTITLPDSLNTIGYEAFSGTAYAKDESNWQNDLLYLGGYLLQTRAGITDCKVKEGTVLFADNVFSDSYKTLTSVILPDSLRCISDDAFSGCKKLKTVSFGKGIARIGDSAFWECKALLAVDLPDSVTSIGNLAFHYCESLKDLTLSENLTTLGDNAFYSCSSIKNVIIPKSVTSIGSSAFCNCRSLTEITLPDSVKSLGTNCFSGCESLASVTLSSGLTKLEDGVFRDCTALKSVAVPDSIEEIGEGAFEYCESLSRVDIGNGVKTVGEEAFYGCPKLMSVTIPRSVKTIEKLAFGYHYIINYNQFYDVTYDGFSVIGYKGSEAQRYADDNGFAFTALPSYGVTVSGKITSFLSDTDNITVELIGVDSVTVKGSTASYSIYDVTPGTYTLRVTKKNHVARDYKVTVKDKDVTQDVELCPFGDVTGDGKTNVQDCTSILRYVRKLDTELSDYQLKRGDVTGDDKVNVQDVTCILRHVRKIETLY